MLDVKPIGASVPEPTRRVAHAAFPKGNVYIWLRDELGEIYQDEDFADLYSSQGQPGISAGQLALVSIMQFLEDLPDRVDAELLVTSLNDYGIELIGPVRADTSWQARQEDAYDLSGFVIDWDNHQATCPQGHLSRTWRERQDNRRDTPIITVEFTKSICRDCPVRELCTGSPTAPRTLTLQPQAQQQALLQAREQQTSQQWWEDYSLRAGIEGTISQAVVGFGIRQSRYRGLAKTHLQHVMTATAINLKRLFAWVQGVPLARTRISPFAALNPLPA
ncbi:MAG: transposase [Xenococcaceae cyanobacterium]